MTTIDDLKALLDSGETLINKDETIYKVPFHNQYCMGKTGCDNIILDYDDLGFYITDPSLWRVRDQIGADYAPRMVVVDAREWDAMFSIHFGHLCHTLFNPEQTLNQMFVDGQSAKDLFESLSNDLDKIGEIVYKDKWDELKKGMKN